MIASRLSGSGAAFRAFVLQLSAAGDYVYAPRMLDTMRVIPGTYDVAFVPGSTTFQDDFPFTEAALFCVTFR